MTSKMKKEDEALMKCYVELYKNSTPQADFKLLVENATINERGQKEIDFMSYEIEEEVYQKIVNSVIKEYKIRGFMKQRFKNTIALGCSPKFSSKK
jgi:hypothetical protein